LKPGENGRRIKNDGKKGSPSGARQSAKDVNGHLQSFIFNPSGTDWLCCSAMARAAFFFARNRTIFNFRNRASESSAMAYLQNRHEEQERAEARVRMHLLKYHVDAVNVLICHIHLPEELIKTQTEKILAEQRQNMYNARREAEVKRIELEKTSSR
jgi:hypothetical protein